jgi:hypothetical protein
MILHVYFRGICGTQEGIFPASYVEILQDNDVMDGSGMSYSNEFKLPMQLLEPCDSAVRLKSTDTIDPLLALSSDAQFPSSAQTSDEQTLNKIFDDDYFKVNMPSMYRSESQNETKKTETPNAQPLVEIDVVPYGITLYPFYAQFDNEVSFHEDEIVTLCRHVDKDWIEGKIDGKKGIFPKSYINILVDCENYTSSVGNTSYNSSSEPWHFLHNDMNFEQPKLTPDLFAKVLYNFDAQMNGDLTVQKDEVVCIVSKANEDWCEVRNQFGKIGLCPQNYLTPYLLPDELKNKSLQETPLATGNLLGSFNSTEENSANNVIYNQYISSSGSRRKYRSHDFMQPGSVCSQKGSSLEDLITKNLETYHISAQTSGSHSNQRHSLDLSENRNADFMSGNADKCIHRDSLSLSPKLQQEDSPSTIEEHTANSGHVATHHPSVSGLPPLQHPEDNKSKPIEELSSESTSWEGGKLSFCFDQGSFF